MSFLKGLVGAATGFLTGGPVGAVVGGAAGYLGGREQDKANKRAQAQQNRADAYSQAQLDLQRQQFEAAQARQGRYEGQYSPIESKYLALVKKGVNPDLEGVTSRTIGDIGTQYSGSEAARLRQMQRMGVNPNSGRADALGRQLSLSRALALSGGINHARQQEINRANDLTFARLQDATQTGINKVNGTQAGLSSAATALSQTYANQASNALTAKQNAQIEGTNAANSWADLGGTIFKAWDQYNTKKNTSKGTVGTGVWL